jgi:hypothetical protein
MFNTHPSEYWQSLMLTLTQQFAQNPYANLEELTRETFRKIFHAKGDKFMNDQAKMMGLPPGILENQPMPQPGQMANQLQNKMTAGVVNQAAIT